MFRSKIPHLGRKARKWGAFVKNTPFWVKVPKMNCSVRKYPIQYKNHEIGLYGIKNLADCRTNERTMRGIEPGTLAENYFSGFQGSIGL